METRELKNSNGKRPASEIIDLEADVEQQSPAKRSKATFARCYMIYNEDGDAQEFVSVSGDEQHVEAIHAIVRRAMEEEEKLSLKQKVARAAGLVRYLQDLDDDTWNDDDPMDVHYLSMAKDCHSVVDAHGLEVAYYKTHDADMLDLPLQRLTVISGYY